jgi:branched-chain amino acid transport system permease protein
VTRPKAARPIPTIPTIPPVARRLAAPTLLLAAVLLPVVEKDFFRLRVLTVAWLLSTLAMGANLSLRWGGLFNMSQGTFYGIGAYTTANIAGRTGLPFELALVVSALLAGGAGLILGLTSLRVRGDLWALVSMAFTVSIVSVFANFESVTNGKDGIGIDFQTLFGVRIAEPHRFYYAAFGLMALSFVVLNALKRSFQGRAMLAGQADEAAGAMMGISLVQVRLGSLTVAAALAGLAGSMLMATTLFVTPSSFEFLPSFDVMLFAIVGGVSFMGSILAATFLTFVTEQYRNVADYRLVIYGAALVAAIMVRSGVASGALRSVAARARRGRA